MNFSGFKIVFLVLCYTSILIFISYSVIMRQLSEIELLYDNISFMANLNSALLNETKTMKNTIKNLQKTVNELNQTLVDCQNEVPEPTLLYEKSRRRIKTNIQFFWEHFKDVAGNLIKSSNLAIDVNNFIKSVREYKMSLLSDLEQMSRNDGYDNWRKKENNDLALAVRSSFEKLQNPADCDKAKILKCYPFQWGGWGCIMHHIAECLLFAQKFQRTMVFDSRNLEYNKTHGFVDILEPFSETCTTTPQKEKEEYYPIGKYQDSRISFIDEQSRYKIENYTARKIPEDLAARLEKLSDDPLAWWNGQLVKLSINYTPKVIYEIQKFIKKVKFKGPIVAVHVRRTDKVAGMIFGLKKKIDAFKLEDYMKHVDEYFDQLELTQKIEKRRIYLASEVPKVILEAQEKYPHYEILSNMEGAKISENINTRWTTNALVTIAVDIYMLSQCDYAVCTLSSNVCRLLLEYFQVRFPDSTNKLVSLDNLYYADYEYDRFGEAVINHTPIFKDEIELKVGDPLQISYDQNTRGLYYVINARTKQKGFVPSYKVQVNAETYKSPKIL